MSDESKKTKAEVKAEIARVEAETAKLAAETVKLNAEGRQANAEATQAELDLAEVERARRRAESADDRNRLYRFSGPVTSSTVSGCMKKLTEWSRLDPECDIEIIFSSPGGSIIDGFELFDFIQHLRNEGHKITTGALGMAASMAGILLQAGDVRWVGHQAWIMIHRAAFGAFGKTYEVEDEVEFVKRIEERILDIFTARSKLTKMKIKRNWDRKDWWISADEALEAHLVDEVRAKMPEVKLALPREKAKKKAKKRKKTSKKN